MDALVPALVAGLLLGLGDKTSWLAAMLADKYQRPGLILLGAGVALAIGNAIAAVAGASLAAMLNPNAQALMLALALLFGAAGVFWSGKRPQSYADWQLGAFGTAFAGVFILSLSEGIQFVTFALAARSPLPALAAIGATIGTLVALIPAVALGEQGWRKLPLRPVRIAVGAALILTGFVVAVGALRLT